MDKYKSLFSFFFLFYNIVVKAGFRVDLSCSGGPFQTRNDQGPHPSSSGWKCLLRWRQPEMLNKMELQ